MENLKSKGISAFLWDFSGRIGNHGVTFVISIFLARMLDPKDFGLIAMVAVIIALSDVFANMGLSSSLIQRKDLFQIHYSSVFYFNLAVASLLTFLLFLFASSIATFYKQPELVPITKVMSLSFIINALVTVHNARFRKQLKLSYIVKFRLIATLFGGLVGITMAIYGKGVWALVVQSLLSRVLYALMIWYKVEWKPSLEFSFKALKQLWGFGFRIFLADLLEMVFQRIDVLIVGRIFPPQILGYFQRSKSFQSILVNYFSTSISQITFPILSNIKNNVEKIRNIFIKSYSVSLWIMISVSGYFFLVAEDLFVMLFGEKWLPSVTYFRILILIVPINKVLVSCLAAQGDSKTILKLEIIKKIFFGVNILSFFFFGLKGYLIGFVLSRYIATFLNIECVKKSLNIARGVLIKPFLLNIALCTLTTATVFLANVSHNVIYISFVLKTILFFLLYFLLSYFLKLNGIKWLYEDILQHMLSRVMRKTT